MKEIWKKIDNYNDYQVSNLGRIKSLKFNKEKILKSGISKDGYLTVCLSNDKYKCKTFTIHQLVAMAFLNHKPCGMKLVINHIDHNRQNNNLCNLELVSQKENIRLGSLNKGIICNDNSEKIFNIKNNIKKYAYWHKGNRKWQATIKINGKFKFLGYHNTEEEAKNAVLTFLLQNKDVYLNK